ncbi:glycosyltransferase [Paraburkholderia sp. GAS334]|uniref:glycosyltransferase n=1 Tax=Paraburkholderia sp. GAS334 TaxID=3035131 RepID=UPI003D1D57D7
MADKPLSALASQAPMQVLIVSSMYPTEANPVGGIFIHEQVKALRSRGIDARVVTGDPLWLSGRRPVRSVYTYLRSLRHQPPAKWKTYDGVPVCRFQFPAGSFSRTWNYPFFYSFSLRRALASLTDGFAYELVHCHTAYLDGRAAAMAARTANVPLILTEHTGPFSSVTERWTMRIHTQAGIDAAHRVIAVSAALKNAICQSLTSVSPDKIVVIPNGTDTSLFDPNVSNAAADVLGADAYTKLWPKFLERMEASVGETITPELIDRFVEDSLAAALVAERARGREAVALDDGEVVNAIWVGHHVDVKRVDRLIDAFAIARRHRPELRLTLVGDGPLKADHQRRAAQLGVEAYTTFLPGKNRHGVKFEVGNASFLVISSEVETFGVVAIEALSMGKPVLSTACGGPDDILNDRRLGELVPNTMEDLALGLQRMAARMTDFDARVIRQEAIARFDFGAVAQRLTEQYDKLLMRGVKGGVGQQQPATAVSRSD